MKSRVVLLAILGLGWSCGRPIIIPKGEIAGHVVVSGPLVGAVVKAYAVGADGKPSGKPLGQSAPTDVSGAFRVSIGSGHGTIYLEAEGPATYVELYGGAKVSLDPGVVVSGLVMDVAADELREGALLTGVTHMAVALARGRLAAGKEATFEAAAARAYALLSAHFMECDLWATEPQDISMAATALTPAVRYSLVLAAFSYLAQQMGSKSSPTLTLNDANSLLLFHLLADDLASSEAQFDGKSSAGGLRLGNCASPCPLSSASVRTDLSRALVDFLSSPLNRSGQDYDKVLGRIDAMSMNQEPELFPPGQDGNPIDTLPPVITWLTPQEGDIVSGAVMIDVQAQDATQVASLGVSLGDTQLVDSDTAPGRFRSQLATATLTDGPLVLVATAADALGNRSSKPVNLTVNNLGPGTINGVCVKGPVKGAQVVAYRFANGVRGEPIGTTATTDQVEGKFRLEGIEDWTGPLLITCSGPAYYDEEAFTFTTDLGSGDKLRAVVKDFSANSATVTATAWTTLAVAYEDFLLRGGMPFTQARDTAYRTMGEALGLEDLERARPVRLDATVTTFNAGTWSAFLDAGLSQLAVMYATRGGVTPGAPVNSKLLLQKLEADIAADGCFDGRDATGQLQIGGVNLTSQTLRYDLALAVATYLTSSRNLTMIRSASDAINQLDALTSQGPTSGGCVAGQVFPDAGHASFDRVGPEITWDATLPPSGSYLDGTQADALIIKASARDDLSPRPSLVFVTPTTAGIRDEDGDTTNQSVVARIQGFEGDLVVKLLATDDAGNTTPSEERSYHIDRSGLAPTITLINVVRPDHWTSSPTVAIQVTSKDPMAQLSVTLDGVAVGVSAMEDQPGAHEVVATATGSTGSRTATASFVIDTLPPEIVPAFPESMYAKSGVTVTAYLDDALKGLAGGGSLPLDTTPPLFDAQVTWDGATGPMVTKKLERDATGRLKLDAYLPLYDGGVTVNFVGQDRVGNLAAAKEWKGVIDSMPPVARLLLTTGADLAQPLDATNPWTKLGVKVDVAVTNTNGQAEPNLDHVSAVIAGQTFTTLPQTITTDGEKPVSVVVYDKAGWESNAAEGKFFVDTGKPLISVVAMCNLAPCPAPAYIREQFALTATLAEGDSPVAQALQQAGSLQGPATFAGMVEMAGTKLALVPGTASGGLTRTLAGSMQTTAANDGEVVITLAGTDRAGNEAVGNEPTRSVWRGTIDNTKPIVNIGLPGTLPMDDRWAAGSVTVNLTAIENNLDHIEATIDAQSYPQYPTPPVTVNGAGEHNVSARAYDKAGWISDPANVTFYIDPTPPMIAVTAPVPSGGWIKEGRYAVTATMTDNLMAKGSLEGMAFFNATATPGRGTITVNNASPDPTTKSLGLGAQVTVPASASGPLSIAFTGNDRVGKQVGGTVRPDVTQTWSVKMDSIAPRLTLKSPNGQWYAADFDLQLALTDEDPLAPANEASGIKTVEVWKTGTPDVAVATTLTYATPPKSVASATMRVSVGALTGGCQTTDAANMLRIRVTDAAGNFSEQSLTVYRDNCAPTLSASQRTENLYNETNYTASASPSSYCLTPGGSQSALTAGANVYKYAVNTSAAGAPACDGMMPIKNTIKWYVEVADGGIGLTASSAVKYEVKYCEGVDIANGAKTINDCTSFTAKTKATPAFAAVTGTSDPNDLTPSSASYEISVTSDTVNELDKLDGFWAVYVTATDAGGNATSASQLFYWKHWLIGGPLSVAPTDLKTDGYFLNDGGGAPRNPYAHSLDDSKTRKFADLMQQPQILTQYFRINNPTGKDTHIVVNPNATATFYRWISKKSTYITSNDFASWPYSCTTYVKVSNPGNPLGGGTCLSSRPADSFGAMTTVANVSLAEGTSGWDNTWGQNATCLDSSGNCTSNTWKVPAGHQVDVWVYSTNTTWRYNVGVGTNATEMTYGVYGVKEFTWIQKQLGYFDQYDYVTWLAGLTVDATDSSDATTMKVQLSTATHVQNPKAAFPPNAEYTVNFKFDSPENNSVP